MVWGWWSPGDAPPTVAIAVRTFDGRNTHVGIAYCAEDKYANDPEERRIHEEFVRKIAPDVTAIRIRPEETAGSCLSDSLPVAFKECESYGKAVLLRLCLSPQ